MTMPLTADPIARAPRQVGRYALFGEIASGGMATVYFGRLIGAGGFSRTVAVKQLHETYAKDPDFVAQFLDEARLTARIHHPNVVPTLDVVTKNGELYLVMEYVQGESLARLMRNSARLPPPIAVAVMCQALLGLHAAHEARSEADEPLHIVHRDVSPQNVLVGVDGVARVLDFGVAKAASRLHTTTAGQIKGKLAYMSPEQLRDRELDRQSDIFACGIVLWEALAGKRLFARNDTGATVTAVLTYSVPLLTELLPDIPAGLAQVVARALEREPEARFPSALAMAEALESSLAPASTLRVGAWVRQNAEQALTMRGDQLRIIEDSSVVQRVPAASGAAQTVESLLPSQSNLTQPGGWGGTPPLPVATTTSAAWLFRGGRPVIAAVAGALLAGAAVVWGVSRGADAAPHASVAVAHGVSGQGGGATERVHSASPNPPETPGASIGASEADVVPIGDLSVESTKSNNPQSKPIPSGRKVVKPRVASAPVKVTTAKTNCDPPFVLDAGGRKHFKAECFR